MAQQIIDLPRLDERIEVANYRPGDLVEARFERLRYVSNNNADSRLSDFPAGSWDIAPYARANFGLGFLNTVYPYRPSDITAMTELWLPFTDADGETLLHLRGRVPMGKIMLAGFDRTWSFDFRPDSFLAGIYQIGQDTSAGLTPGVVIGTRNGQQLTGETGGTLGGSLTGPIQPWIVSQGSTPAADGSNVLAVAAPQFAEIFVTMMFAQPLGGALLVEQFTAWGDRQRQTFIERDVLVSGVGQRQVFESRTYVVRHQARIDTNSLLLVNDSDRLWNIVSVQALGRRQYLQLDIEAQTVSLDTPNTFPVQPPGA